MSSKPTGKDDVDLAVAVVARASRRSVRSASEALTLLRRRGLPAEVAAGAIARCRALGVVDDQACARLWADQWARQGYAWAAIQQKLAAKGLEADALEAADQRLRLSAGDGARARSVAEALCGRSARAGRRVRVARALASKGFNADLIEQVLDQILGPAPSHAES